MTTTIIIGLVALGVAVITLVALVMSKLVYHFMKSPLEARIGAHYGQDEVLMKDLAWPFAAGSLMPHPASVQRKSAAFPAWHRARSDW